jgi:hypothetical protein
MKKLYLIYAAALLALLYFDKALSLVMSVFNYVSNPIHDRGVILLIIGLILIITIEILRHCYPIRSPKLSISISDAYPLYNDQPSNIDSYGRSSSACLLISKIFSTFSIQQQQGADGALVININEAYGAGKTTFLKIIEQELASSHHNQYTLIKFRPWLCESEQAIIRELFTLLGNQLDIDSVKSDLRQYLHLLLLQTEQIAPAELKPFYAFIPHKQSNKTLQQLHDDIKSALQHIDRPIIVAIDDVDRLQEKELIAVLKLIRDTADFPNIFYIVAADNSHLEVMLHKQGIENPAVFLQKFFNLDFLLPAHESIPAKTLRKELNNILHNYGYSPKVVSTSLMMLPQIPHLNKVFANLRDVYRFLNIYTSSLDLLRSNNNLFHIDPFELFCLTIIRHLRIDIYKKLRDRNDELLEAIYKGLDSYYRMKPEANIAKKQNDKRMLQHISQARGVNTSPEERNRQIEAEAKRTLDEAIKMTEISSDAIVSTLLDRLFGSPRQKSEYSICRCNVYFLYFTGRFESNKLSTAESVNIINLSQKEYENKLKQLIETNQLDAFHNNFSYAYSKSNIDKEEALKKFYILQKIQYQLRKDNDSSIRMLFEEFINRNHDSYMFFLFELYGNHISHDGTEALNSIKTKLEAYCKTESDLHMLILAFSIISSQLSGFCFGRDFLEKMFNLLSDRLISEKMTKDHVNQVEPTTFETIRIIKDEFSYQDKWLKKFESFLDEDESRCRQWLGYMVDILPNGNVDWNYHHHDAVLGEYANSGEELLNHLKQKFPDCSKAIEELSRLQNFSSLEGRHLTDSNYYQMVREAHGIDKTEQSTIVRVV